MKSELLKSYRSKHGLVRLKRFTSTSGSVSFEVIIYAPSGLISFQKFNSYLSAVKYYYFLIPKSARPPQFRNL